MNMGGSGELQEIFSAKASIYQLSGQKWEERGVGGILYLYASPGRRDELILRWSKKFNLVELNYTLRPGKIKTSGTRAWVVKSTARNHDGTSQTAIIALRFVTDDKSELFAEIYQRLADAEDISGEGPAEDGGIRPWNCNMCTFTNDGHSRACDMCGTSRVGHRDSDDSSQDTGDDRGYQDEVDSYLREAEEQPWRCAACTFENPSNYQRCDMCGRTRQGGSSHAQDSEPYGGMGGGRMSNSSVDSNIARSFHGGGLPAPMSPPYSGRGGLPPPIPPRNGKWECINCTLQNEGYEVVCAACGAEHPGGGRLAGHSFMSSRSLWDPNQNDSSGPNEEIARHNFVHHLGHRDHRGGIQTTKIDFQVAASHIAAAPNYDKQVFSTLKSVARKLMKDDPRYRLLDASNRKVREKLVGYEGVLDFLELLGFESDAFGTKLQCNNPPPHHVVNDAIEILDTYLENRPNFPEEQGGAGDGPDGGTGDYGHDHVLNANVTRGGGQRPPEENKQDADHFTLEQIVLWVTQPSQRERENEDVLVMCYFTISSPQTLVRSLRDRYFSVPLPQNLTEEQQQEFVKKQQRPVQLKVGNLLKNWLKCYWREDFADNEEAQLCCTEFLQEMGEQSDAFNTSLARAISNLFSRLKDEVFESRSLELLLSAVETDERRLAKIIGSKSCDEIADQMTLMDFYIFQTIQPRECLGQAWKKKDRAVRAPNILAMIAQFNNLVKWVQIQILSEKSLRDRGRAIKRVIKMGERFRLLQNFNSLCAIFSALNAACIHRLKLAWERVPPKQQRAFDEFKVIFARDKNQKNLRTMLRQAAAPSIPHIGIFLQDLVFIDDGNQTRKNLQLNEHDDAQIFNFDKARRLAERIKTISLYQQRPYDITEDQVVQKILYEEMIKLKDMTEDEIWEMSTVIKKSDEKDAKSWL